MNLTKLFETQKILRDRINYNEPDRFNKLILALLVELGECANEWRGFKFWSTDQESKTLDLDLGKLKELRKLFKNLDKVDGFNLWDYTKNPLLEEYVDGLHFVLELGLEREKTTMTTPYDAGWIIKKETVTEQFNALFDKVGDFSKWRTVGNYAMILDLYIGLGEMLGFTWERVEEAYYKKNQINHDRQDSGY